MEVGSAASQALVGMQRSQSEIAGSAQQIAEASTGSAQPSATQPASSLQVVEPMINIQAQEQVFDANARVLEAADENTGRLIDTLA